MISILGYTVSEIRCGHLDGSSYSLFSVSHIPENDLSWFDTDQAMENFIFNFRVSNPDDCLPDNFGDLIKPYIDRIAENGCEESTRIIDCLIYAYETI